MRTTKFENDHSPISENPANPQAETNKIVRQRLIFFSIERVERAEYVERMERGGDGERTGTGTVFKICEGGDSGADLVV